MKKKILEGGCSTELDLTCGKKTSLCTITVDVYVQCNLHCISRDVTELCKFR